MYGSFFRGIAHNNPSPKDHGSFREDTSASNTLTENPWDLPADPQISLAPMHYSCSEAYQNDYYIHDDKDDHKDHQNQNKSNSSAEDPAPNTSGQPQEHYPEGSATITSCVINLANTIVGAGMLGLPGALAGSGFVGGSILMILGATFSAHGLVLLSKAAQQAGLPSSFYSVAKEAVPQYTMLIDLAVACKCFGVATGYLITVGDCMVDALDHLLLNPVASNGYNPQPTNWLVAILLSRQFWIVGAVLAVLPVAFYRTLDELKKASALALVFVFFLVFGIVAYANGLADPCLGVDGYDIQDCRGEVVAFTDAPTTAAKLPIFVFAFTCHQNIFPVVNELQRRTQERLNRVIVFSIGFAMVLFLVVALEGVILLDPTSELDPSRRCIMSLIHAAKQQYYGKKDGGASQKVHHRDSDNDLITAAADGTKMTKEQSTMTVSQDDDDDDGIKDEIEDEKNSNQHSTTKQEHSGNFAPDERQNDLLFYCITVAFLLLSFAVAMVVDDLGVILAMVGATGSTLVSYILPGLIYVKIHPRMDISKLGAYIQLCMGCLIMPLALYFVLMGKVKH